MKKILFTLLFLLGVVIVHAQNYNNLLNYNYNGTPTYGVKIITNIPYTSGTQMPTIHIKGYNYGTADVIDISLVYYIYSGEFINYQITSAGSYTPAVYLAEENSKVVIFIDDRSYYQRFTVSAYAQGMSEQSSWFQNWSTANESLSATHTVLLPYGENLPGTILMSNGIWNDDGSLRISTTTIPTGYKLAVNGSMIATSIKVKPQGSWPDYVFKPKYNLPSLTDVKTYIDQYQHLPDVPSANTIEKDGQDLGEMNKILLKKVEELTLYLIEKDKNDEIKDKKLASQQNQIDDLKKQLELLTKEIRKK
jgi:hypothetical protein